MLKLPTLIKKFCDALLEYDAETKQLYWYHNDRVPELSNSFSDYEDSYKMYKERFVCKDDYAVWDMFMAPDRMRDFAKGSEKESHFYVRFENIGQGMEWHEIFLEKMEDAKVIIGSRDMRDIYRSAAITRAVIPEFDYVCFIDIETGGYVVYYPDADKRRLPEGASDDYHCMMEQINKAYIVPEEAETLTEHMRIPYVQQQLEKKDEYILYATMKDQDVISYKKLCFSYADATKRKLLLIRTDVSDTMIERKLREKEERKRLAYLDHMPVACVSAEVFVDEEGEPYDFRITYSNQAYAKLIGKEIQELLSRNFYEIFPNADRRRLHYYYETAYKGIPHIINWEMSETNKHLLIHIFQTEEGEFGSMMVDITEEHFLTKELQKNREEMQRLLEITTDLVFRYYPDTREVDFRRMGKEQIQSTFKEQELIQKITENQWVNPEYVAEIEGALLRVRSGEHHLSINIKACLGEGETWKWYRMTMFDFQTEYTHERKIFGYLQDIDQDILRQEELRKKAQMDPLTKVMNAGAGRKQIEKILKKQQGKPNGYNAMFLMDIDDFKRINDTYGHLVGDRTLEAFGEILKNTFRKEDVVYRLGGDEFVAFVKNIQTPEQSIDSIMCRLNEHMEQVREKYSFFSSSIGVYVTNQPCSFEQYYIEADQVLYETKKQGKSHYTVKQRT